MKRWLYRWLFQKQVQREISLTLIRWREAGNLIGENQLGSRETE